MTRAYARYEQTSDISAGDRQDVQLYRDETCTQKLARFMWYNSRKPNSKTCVVNVAGSVFEMYWVE